MTDRNDTAILLFSESARVLLSKKKLDNTSGRNFGLIKGLLTRSFKVAKQSGLDYIHLDEAHQRGETFGAKLSNAIQHVFNLGYEKVIAIGNDCPDLTPKDLVRASNRLESHDMVIGPDLKGGTYLIGTKKSTFNPVQFEKLAWQDSALRQSFVHYASRLGFSIDWMTPKVDFNTAAEVRQHWSLSAEIRKLVSALFRKVTITRLPVHGTRLTHVTVANRRGPPYL